MYVLLAEQLVLNKNKMSMMIHKNTSTCYYIIYGYNYHNGAKFHMEWIFADLKYTRKKIQYGLQTIHSSKS